MGVNMDTFFNQQTSHGIMGDDDQEDDSISSSSSLSNVSSNSSEFMEDATSSPSPGSSPSSVLNSDHKNGTTTTTTGGGRGGGGGPLYEMNSLMQQLPFKRGLSKHYQGKSQSFTSLSNVRCLEDLAKPSKKKLKSCKSYGGGLSETTNKVSLTKTCSKVISKKGSSSRGSWSSLSGGAKRPPVAPQRNSSNLFNRTPLFA